MRRLSKGLPALGLAWCLADPALGQDLCTTLTIPAQLGLICTAAPDATVTIMPAAGAFGALSRMTVRPLDRAAPDDLAWSDPAKWLRGQVTVDPSTLVDTMAGLADDPDSPFAGPSAREALARLKTALGGLAQLPLNACEQPTETKPDRWEMTCRFTADGLGLLVDLRLLGEGDRRWAMNLRAANEQRLRHFEAIANSFQPG